MYKITLKNGFVIDNLTLNGNNYISESIIEDSVFENNLAQITITDTEQGTENQYQDLKLMSNIIRNGKSWIILGQKSKEELEKEQIKSRLNLAQQAINFLIMKGGV